MPVDAHTRELAQLLDMSQRWLHDYPDLGQAADVEAKRLLRAYPLPSMDIHSFYWHRFDNAQSSPKAFTGWVHSGPPVQSLSLPELVLQRFPFAAQDNLDQLDVFSGFYAAPAQQGAYDETHQLPLLPSQLSADFWRADFAGHYRDKLAYFWRTRTSDFIALSRASALASLGHARNQGVLSSREITVLRGALANGLGRDVSPGALGRHRPPRPDVQITDLSISGHSARHVLRIHSATGKQYLYLPGSEDAFEVFDSDAALASWLTEHTHTAKGLNRLRQHFPASDMGLDQVLGALAKGTLAPGWLGGEPLPQGRDPFAWLAERAKAEMEDHAHRALTSNSRLRKDEAIAFLSTLSGLATNLAPLGWPVALLGVASASITLGLDIEKAINARTTTERKEAIGAAVGAGLSILLTLPFLGSGEVVDWPWDVDETEPAPWVPTALPSSPVSPWPLNARGMIERTDMDVLFTVKPAERGVSPTTLLDEGLPATVRFPSVPPMLDGAVIRAFGNAEGALAHAKANFDGPFHLFRLQARGLRVASLRHNVRFNRSNTLALLGQEDRSLNNADLQALGDGAWLEHEVHVAATDLRPARLRLLSPTAIQPWRRPALNVLRGVQRQQLNSLVAPAFLIEAQDTLRLVRFDPFSESWRTPGGTAFRYNSASSLFERFDAAHAPEALAPAIEAATAELDMPATYPWRIPDLPTSDRLPLPRMIHSLWLGRRMPGRLVDNLLRNAAEAGTGQAPFDYHLYLAVNDPLDHALTLADLAGAPANLHIHELEETEFFREFQGTPYHQQYLAATEGSGINYASAADVLRYRLVHYYGGVYMDVDDVIYAGTMSQPGFADQPWAVAPGRLLLNGLVSEPRLGLHCGFNTSNFASLPKNPLLEAISEESYLRYLTNRDLYRQRPYEGADPREQVTAYARRINQVTGPGVFNDVLMAQQADVRQFRSVCRIATELYVPARHLAALHQQIRVHTPNYCPLAWRIRIGATSSWLHTR